MVKTIDEYMKRIKKALRDNKIYSQALDIQVLSLASAFRTLDLANRQIDSLEETTVVEMTCYGEKLAPHPVFKIAKDAQELITRQMKILKLTAEDLSGNVEDDPLADLTKKLNKKRTAPYTIKTDTDNDGGRER